MALATSLSGLRGCRQEMPSALSVFGLCIAVYDEAGDYDIAELLPPFPAHIPVRIIRRPGRFMKAPVRHTRQNLGDAA